MKASLGVLAAASVVVAGALVVSKGDAPPASSRIVRGPYLQPGLPGSITVAWYTATPAEGTLEWREEGGSWTEVRDPSGIQTRHEVALEGIQDGFPYRYRILGSGRVLEDIGTRSEFAFGAPRSDALKMIVFGDCGSGSPQQAALARVMFSENPLPDLALVVGDLVYPSGADADYDPKFFAIYGPLMSRVPFYALLGNHDYETRRGAPFFSIFVLPGNGPKELPAESLYSFERAGLHVTVHDSNLPKAAFKQIAVPWHVADVRGSSARFRIAALHHTPYSSSTNSVKDPTPLVREILPPVFSGTGIDLVLAGHDHAYERTRPIGGVVYVTTGAGGYELYPKIASNEWSEVFYGQGDRNSYTTVEVKGRMLTLRQTDVTGCRVDSLALHKPVGEGDPWKVFQGAAPAGWTLPAFDDRGWPVLAAPIGYGSPDLATPLSETSMTGLALYARAAFVAGAPSSVEHLMLRIRYDDGFVAYLNGVEVGRENVPAGQGPLTPASSAHSGEWFETVHLPASLLRMDQNVLAIEVHNRAQGDGSFLMAPELTLVASQVGRCR